jgi:hypothetical protein
MGSTDLLLQLRQTTIAQLLKLEGLRRMPASSQKVSVRTERLGHRLHAPRLPKPLVSHRGAAFF